jgi:putative transposase
LLSSYTKGIQKQENITGNLFQQKTKSKCVDDYAFTAFHYIHQNAYRAKLADKLETYQYCSVNDYLLAERESMCNRIKAMELLGMNGNSFLRDSYAVIDDDMLKEIW